MTGVQTCALPISERTRRTLPQRPARPLSNRSDANPDSPSVSPGLLSPSLLLTLFAERELGVHGSLPIRLLLVLPSLLGVFALGLLNRYDLEKVSSLPLPGAWLPRVRDFDQEGGK